MAHRQRRNGPEGEKDRGEEGGGGLRLLTEACLRVVGRNNLNNTEIAAFQDNHPLSLPSGLEVRGR